MLDQSITALLERGWTLSMDSTEVWRTPMYRWTSPSDGSVMHDSLIGATLAAMMDLRPALVSRFASD